MVMKNFKKGSILIKETDLIREFWFIKSGRISAWKLLVQENKMVRVDELRIGSYFGEIKVRKQNTLEPAHCELRCETDVEIGVLAERDAYLKLPKSLPLSSYSTMNQLSVYNEYLDYLSRQELLRTKRKYLNSLLKERMRDPTLTQKAYRTNQTVGDITRRRIMA